MTELDQYARCLDGNYAIFRRDVHLERTVSKALKKEWVPVGDWFVCDCGEFVRKIIVTGDGLKCPQCQPNHAREPVEPAVFALSPGAAFLWEKETDLATDKLSRD